MSKYYSGLKIFHFDSKLKDMVSGRLSPPLHIRLKPKNKCNHSCSYCCYRTNKLFLGSELFNEEDEIPWTKMQELINDFKEMGVKAVTLSGGGEPLSYKYIIETVEQLHQAGIKVATLTNGSFLKGEIAGTISHLASWVRISMDAADAKTYAGIRSVDLNEFDKVCTNIKAFSKMANRNCELGINFIVTKSNHRDTYKFLELMKNLGVNHVKVSECVVSTKGEENVRYFSSMIKPVREQMARAFSNLVDDNFTIIDKFASFDDKSNNYLKEYTQCPMIQSLIVIAADMNVYTCQDKAYTKSGKVGSIKNMSFKEFWSSSQVEKRILGLNPSVECNHHCTQHLKNLDLLEYMEARSSHLEFV